MPTLGIGGVGLTVAVPDGDRGGVLISEGVGVAGRVASSFMVSPMNKGDTQGSRGGMVGGIRKSQGGKLLSREKELVGVGGLVQKVLGPEVDCL